MDIYLVRHGVAEPRGAEIDDAPRRLTEDGIARLRRVADGLSRLGVEVDAVLSSPYPRAWETAELLSDELGWPAPAELVALAPGGSAAECLAALSARAEAALAVVGHEPNLSELASLLLAGAESLLRIDLRKAGVVCLSGPPGLSPGSCVLRWSASPRMLRRLARPRL